MFNFKLPKKDRSYCAVILVTVLIFPNFVLNFDKISRGSSNIVLAFSSVIKGLHDLPSDRDLCLLSFKFSLELYSNKCIAGDRQFVQGLDQATPDTYPPPPPPHDLAA